MIRIDTVKYEPTRYEHFGYVVEECGIHYTVWLDFVHLTCNQPWVNSLAEARAAIAFELAKNEAA